MQCITPGCTNPAQLTPQGVDADGWDDPNTVVPICAATRHVDSTVTPLMAVNGAVVLLLVLLVAIITVHKIRGDHDE
jgi:hypothetical protein